MALDLGGSKKKQNEKSKYSIIQIDIHKPSKKKYVEIDYEEVRRGQLQEGESSGEDERFHDREAMELVRRLEAKYGSKKTKKGKKFRFGNEDDFIDKGAGYDLEDAFIDDSEAYDELIPSTMDTAKGGFYVNKGTLHFKSKHDELDESDLSDEEEEQTNKAKKAKKRAMIASDEEAEAVDTGDDQEAQASADEPMSDTCEPVAGPSDATAAIVKPKPQPQLARMTGAPPSKKFASSKMVESPAQKAAKAIRKRVAGLPKSKLLNKNFLSKKPTVIPSLTSLATNTASATSAPVTSDDEEIVIMDDGLEKEQQTAEKQVTSSMSTLKVTNGSDVVLPAASATPTTNAATLPTTAFDAMKQMTGSSPTKRPLPPMTDTLTKMVSEFKRVTSNLALPGQKKRLQSAHIDMVIAIEVQCMKDGYNSHEKARVLNSLADYCGIQKNSLMARIVKKKEEAKLSSLTVSAPSVQKSASTSLLIGSSGLVPTKAVSAASSSSPAVLAAPAPSTSSSTNSDVQIISPSKAATNATRATPTKMLTQQQQLMTAQVQAALSKMVQSANATNRAEMMALLAKVQSNSVSLDEFMELQMKLMAAETQKSNPNAMAMQALAAVKTKAPTPVLSTLGQTNKAAPSSSSSSPVVAAGGPSKPPAPIKKTVVPKKTLADYLKENRPDTSKPSNIGQDEAMKLINIGKDHLMRAVTKTISTSKVLHQKRVTEAANLGKPAPKFAFVCSELVYESMYNLLSLLKDLVNKLYPQGQEAKRHEGLNGFFTTHILTLFEGNIKPGKLWAEYCRRYPDHSSILNYPVVQKQLSDENIDISKMPLLSHLVTNNKKSTPSSLTAKAAAAGSSSNGGASPSSTSLLAKPSGTNNSSAVSNNSAPPGTDDDIQFLDEEGNIPSSALGSLASTPVKPRSNGCLTNGTPFSTPSTSSLQPLATSTPIGIASTSSSSGGPGGASASGGARGASATSVASSINNMLPPAELAKIQQVTRQLTANGTDQQQILAMQQAMVLQLLQSAQSAKDKQSMEEKAKRKRQKEEEKQRQIAQRKAEMVAAKQKVLEEKKQKAEEERRQKAEEKAKKAEEERQRRLAEQLEKEKRQQEENERRAREEQERKRREEEEQRLIEQARKMEEEQIAREAEERRLEHLRQEEELAASLLQEEVSMESGDPDDIPQEVISAREAERQAEEERVRRQQEQGEAARAAARAAGMDVKPFGAVAETAGASCNGGRGAAGGNFLPEDKTGFGSYGQQQQGANTSAYGDYHNNQQMTMQQQNQMMPDVAMSIPEMKPVVRKPSCGALSNSSSIQSPGGFIPPPAGSSGSCQMQQQQSPMMVQQGNGFTYPGSHGSVGVAQSPQQMQTPPAFGGSSGHPMRSPIFQQSPMNQSPCQQQSAVQSPMMMGGPLTPQHQQQMPSGQPVQQQQPHQLVQHPTTPTTSRQNSAHFSQYPQQVQQNQNQMMMNGQQQQMNGAVAGGMPGQRPQQHGAMGSIPSYGAQAQPNHQLSPAQVANHTVSMQHQQQQQHQNAQMLRQRQQQQLQYQQHQQLQQQQQQQQIQQQRQQQLLLQQQQQQQRQHQMDMIARQQQQLQQQQQQQFHQPGGQYRGF